MKERERTRSNVDVGGATAIVFDGGGDCDLRDPGASSVAIELGALAGVQDIRNAVGADLAGEDGGFGRGKRESIGVDGRSKYHERTSGKDGNTAGEQPRRCER